MPRFVLREFSRPDYRGSLPAHDPNNAIWPRISAFAKMLHDISWEDDGDKKPNEDDVRLASEDAAEDMKDYSPTGEAESSRMEGYHPQTEEERKQQEQESESRAPADMGRQAEIAESNQSDMEQFIKNFDPKTASKEEIRQMQRIIAPADAELIDPDEANSRGYFDDAIWGNASKKALADYMNAWGY